MGKVRKLIAILLVMGLMSTVFVACGNSEKDTDVIDTTTVTTDTKDAATEATTVEEEDMAEITMVSLVLGPVPAGAQAIEDAINAITEEKINVHVKLELIDVGNYADQVSLKISSNEKMDLMLTTPIPTAGFSSMTAQKQLLPLNEYLDQYGKDLVATVGNTIKGTTVDGNIYAIPTYRSLVTSTYVVMRTDMLQEQNLLEKAQNMKSFTEYEEILKVMSEKYPISAMVPNDGDGTLMEVVSNWLDQDAFADASAYDTLGDSYKLVGVDYGTTQVYNYFASEKYKAMIERGIDWYEKGYIYEDGATTDEHGDSLIKANAGFSELKGSEIGVETSMKGATNYDMTCVKIGTPPIATGSTTKFAWAVPVTATEPEAAVKFMNLMYTDKDICNLLAWGIEGTDYEVVDGVAGYPAGKDASTVAYHSVDFMYGNQFLLYPWQGQTADFREVALAEMNAAGTSEFLGFSCNTTNISNELTAVANVIAEYKKALESGTVGIEYYDEFLAKLEDAGASVIIAEYQKQLDTWLAANK